MDLDSVDTLMKTVPNFTGTIMCTLGEFRLVDGKLHSDEGPACKYTDGTVVYFENGRILRNTTRLANSEIKHNHF
jgi:hypothetical protein